MDTTTHSKLLIFLSSLLDNPLLNQLLLNTGIVLQPVVDILMPHQTVLAVNNPMALIREMQEPRRYTQTLQHVEELVAFGHNNAVVEIICNTNRLA